VTTTFDGQELSPGTNSATATFVAVPPPGPVVSIPNSDFEVTATAQVPADGTASHTVTVRLRDTDRDPVTGEHAQLSGVAGTALVTDFTETATSGTYTAQVTSTAAGSFPVQVMYAGQSIAAGLANAVAVFVAVPPPSLEATISVAPLSAQTGSPVSVTVSVVDTQGSPVEGAAIHLWTTPVLTPPFDVTGVTGANGQFVREFTSDAAGEFGVLATADSVAVPGSPVTVTFTEPAAPVVSLRDSGFQVSATANIPADGASAQVLTVTLRDTDLNPLRGQAGQLTAAVRGASVGAFAETSTPGVYTAEVTSTAAGTFPVQVFYSGQPLTVVAAGNAEAVFVAAPATSPPPTSGSPAPGSPTPSPSLSTSATPSASPSPQSEVTPSALPTEDATAGTPSAEVTAETDDDAADVLEGTQPKTGAGNLAGRVTGIVLLAGLGLLLLGMGTRRRIRSQLD
jgi:adhesin/invasin